MGLSRRELRDARIIDSSAGRLRLSVHGPSLLITGHPSDRCGLIPQVALVRHSGRPPHAIPLQRSVYLINLGAQRHESITAEKNM